MGLSPKKHLGQHFLRDREVAVRMVELLKGCGGYDTVLEIGPGEGVLTRLLLRSGRWKVHAVEVDAEAVAFLKGRAEFDELVLHEGDVRRVDFGMLPVPVGVIGNLPYHLSSDIVLRLVSVRGRVSEVVCMFQKEVALRLSGKAGSRHYGRLSVLAQTYYDITYAFSVASEAFFPKPKVESAVLCWRRESAKGFACGRGSFFSCGEAGVCATQKDVAECVGGLVNGGCGGGRGAVEEACGRFDGGGFYPFGSGFGEEGRPVLVPQLEDVVEQNEGDEP